MAVTVDFDVPYTLAFCVSNDHVLMLHRKKPPNKNVWNGLGGKIEPGETPHQNVVREVLEEAGIEVDVNEHCYKGIIKWNIVDEKRVGGAHLFVFHLEELTGLRALTESDEGKLEWKSIEWVADSTNTELVANIPYFFLPAVNANAPKVYEFFYENGNQLPDHFIHDLDV